MLFLAISYGLMGIAHLIVLMKQSMLHAFDQVIKSRMETILMEEGLDSLKVRELKIGRRFRIYETISEEDRIVKELVFSHLKNDKNELRHVVLECHDLHDHEFEIPGPEPIDVIVSETDGPEIKDLIDSESDSEFVQVK